jgi:hypothetical protein
MANHSSTSSLLWPTAQKQPLNMVTEATGTKLSDTKLINGQKGAHVRRCPLIGATPLPVTSFP